MKKFLLTGAWCVLCFSCLYAQPAKYDAETARRIAKALPAALPQSPKLARPRTDAQDVDLKGNVCGVTYRHTDDADPRYPRNMLTLEEFYGEDGNRTRTVEWDDVHPAAVTIYGYLDGMRVSRRNTVEPPGNGPDVLSGHTMYTVPEAEDAAVKRDKRYDMREAHTYDSRGRLAESTNFDNAGRILIRTTYTYKTDTHRIVRFYGAGKEPIAKVDETVDPASGHVVEERLYDEDDNVSTIRWHAYKVDERGNWIIKKTTETSPRSGSSRRVPVETTHRMITYYP